MWGRLAVLIALTALMASASFAQEVSGDLNTAVGDGSTVDSNNVSNSNTYNGGQGITGNPVPSAIAPTIMPGGNDSCLIPKSSGMQLSIFGIARSEVEQDSECNRRKDARLLGTPQAIGGLGLQVSAISLMCSEATAAIMIAMFKAGTPCPIYDMTRDSLAIGRRAIEIYRSNPDVFLIQYQQNKAVYDALLWIGKDLPDVQETYTGPTISQRFRRNGAGANLQPTSGGGE